MKKLFFIPFYAFVHILMIQSCSDSQKGNSEQKLNKEAIIAQDSNVVSNIMPESVDVIYITDITDEEEYYMSFFVESNAEGKPLSGGNAMKILDISGLNTIFARKISQNALSHLAIYIDKYCQDSNAIVPNDSIQYSLYIYIYIYIICIISKRKNNVSFIWLT